MKKLYLKYKNLLKIVKKLKSSLNDIQFFLSEIYMIEGLSEIEKEKITTFYDIVLTTKWDLQVLLKED